METKQCTICTKEYKVYKHRLKETKYCSLKCLWNRFPFKEPLKKTCLRCNSFFYRTHSSLQSWEKRKYCSLKCVQSHFKKNCLQCKKIMIVFPADIKDGRGKYCSRKCVALSQRTRIKRNCNYCKKQFVTHLSVMSKFCSKYCYDTSRKGTILKKCLHCQKEFVAKLWNIGRSRDKYCSKSCASSSAVGSKGSNWKGGKIKKNCITCNNLFYIDHGKKEKSRYCSVNCYFTSKEPTSIEIKVYEELKSRGLLFERQKLINGKFIVDAYIPSLNLVIEADGNYWHSLKENMARDKSKNAYLTKCGYGLLRLTEVEINNGEFRNKIEKAVD